MATVTETPVVITNPIADPAPLGLAGFALTTLLLSGVNAGKIGSGGLIFVGMALFYGGLAQFCAGMWEFKRNNTFGATAFGSFGAFWMGAGILFVFDHFTVAPATPFVGPDGFTWFLFGWAVFTTYMFIASLRVSGAVAAVFLLLLLTFWCLWGGSGLREGFGNGWTQIGGYLGIGTAAVAFYASFAGVTNLTWGRTILPTFPLNVPRVRAR